MTNNPIQKKIEKLGKEKIVTFGQKERLRDFPDLMKTISRLLAQSRHDHEILVNTILEQARQEKIEMLEAMEKRIPNVESINPSYFRDVLGIFKDKLKEIGKLSSNPQKEKQL